MSSYIEYAKKDYEDWFYLSKAKGEYKKCSKCGKVKVKNIKHFRKRSKSKDGYEGRCIECEKERDRKRK